MRSSRCVIGLLMLAAFSAAPAWGLAPGAYDLHAEGSECRAANPAQGFDAWIGPDKLRVRASDDSWELGLALTSFKRDGAVGEVVVAGVEGKGPRAELHRGALVEWYENTVLGLEQGFTLHERPSGAGPLVLEMALEGGLLALAEEDGREVSLIQPGGTLAVLRYSGLKVEDAAGRELGARLEVRADEGGGGSHLRIVVDDGGAVYPVTIDPLITGAAWSSAESDQTGAVAWGDWDGDGDLDLAVGNWFEPNRVYANAGGALTLAWTSVENDHTASIAWADWDLDGDLDLAAGNSGQANRVYANTGGTLESTWTSAETDATFSVAWGDWDGDGDLDLAAGNSGQANRVYANTGGNLALVWSSNDTDGTVSVAWGDWDGDGDLDLAAGNNGQPNRVYENLGGALALAWTSADSDDTFSVAWGDWDGDGDLDLAAGNNGPNRVYANTGGALIPTWTSGEWEDTRSVVWGDWDGDRDLDLATGNNGQPNRVYENLGGALASAWTSNESDATASVAWGDWDGDDDLDLAAGNHSQPNRVYENAGNTLASTWTFIPAAAVAGGAQGAFFQTDVEINNQSASDDATVTFGWLPRGADNSEFVTSGPITLGPGKSMQFENALVELFGLGPDSLGALVIISDTPSVVGMSRTYNLPGGQAAGTFGQGLPAIPTTEMLSGTKPQRIIFVSENTDSRANIGCVNGSERATRVFIELFNSEGVSLETKTIYLPPYSNNQINRVFHDYAPVNGYVDVWANRDDALYICYGSMLDNLTSDPTTILPQALSDRKIFIPAAALAAGLEGAFFRTDLDLNNVGSTDITYELLWLPRGADNSDPARSSLLVLRPGAGVRYANVLGEVFGLEPDRIGALAIDASGVNLLAMSRTYNSPGAKAAGTFGQELAGVSPEWMITSGRVKRIIFMHENDDTRANLGCVNGVDHPILVTIDMHDADGRRLETKFMHLGPWSNNQLNRLFRDHAPVNGYVDVSTETPYATFFCYGSVLDNLTSDPTTVLPQ